MLILNRNLNQRIFIGKEIIIWPRKIIRNTVQFGIIAPKDILILREELEPFADNFFKEGDECLTQRS